MTRYKCTLMHDTYPQVKHLGVSLDLNFSTGSLLYRDCNSIFKVSKLSCSRTQLILRKLYIDLQFTKYPQFQYHDSCLNLSHSSDMNAI